LSAVRSCAAAACARPIPSSTAAASRIIDFIKAPSSPRPRPPPFFSGGAANRKAKCRPGAKKRCLVRQLPDLAGVGEPVRRRARDPRPCRRTRTRLPPGAPRVIPRRCSSPSLPAMSAPSSPTSR
jgi:hypothetical protein